MVPHITFHFTLITFCRKISCACAFIIVSTFATRPQVLTMISMIFSISTVQLSGGLLVLKTDCWAMGTILWEFATGRAPWGAVTGDIHGKLVQYVHKKGERLPLPGKKVLMTSLPLLDLNARFIKTIVTYLACGFMRVRACVFSTKSNQSMDLFSIPIKPVTNRQSPIANHQSPGHPGSACGDRERLQQAYDELLPHGASPSPFNARDKE